MQSNEPLFSVYYYNELSLAEFILLCMILQDQYSLQDPILNYSEK